jgi:head-tail adaptor
MVLHAGRLRENVTVQVATEAEDPTSHGVVQSWRDLGVEPMGVEPLEVREPFADGAAAAFATKRFIRRYRSDRILSPKTHRLVYGGKTYDIKGVQDVTPRVEVHVIAEARAE